MVGTTYDMRGRSRDERDRDRYLPKLHECDGLKETIKAHLHCNHADQTEEMALAVDEEQTILDEIFSGMKSSSDTALNTSQHSLDRSATETDDASSVDEEQAILDEIFSGMKLSSDTALDTSQHSFDRSATETDDASPSLSVENDKSEIWIWREDFRQDIRTGIVQMNSIHQQMLDQHIMLEAPEETRNKYYRAIAHNAIQRAELESKKIGLETERTEVELKIVDFQLRKVEIQERGSANKVNSSDADQRTNT